MNTSIGSVVGTKSSESIEKLFGYAHEKNIDDEVLVKPGKSWVIVQFNPQQDVNDDEKESTERETTTEDDDEQN